MTEHLPMPKHAIYIKQDEDHLENIEVCVDSRVYRCQVKKIIESLQSGGGLRFYLNLELVGFEVVK